MTKFMERLKEIEARRAELNTEANSAEVTETRLAEITTEAESLNREEMEVRAKMALQTNHSAPVATPENESRAEEFVRTGRMVMETRQLLSTGHIAKPTQVGGINGMAASAADIVDDVHAFVLNGVGTWRAAYQATGAAAAAVTEGQAVGGTGATFNYVDINPAEWGILDEISKQVKKQSPLDYQGAIEDSAVSALRDFASAKILAAVQASSLKQAIFSRALDQNFLRNTVLGFRPIKGKGACKLYISQADLATLGAVRGTNEKKALYEITFDNETNTSGTIKEGGMAAAFRILDGLTAGTQLYGQPATIDMPMWGNYAVETDEGGDYFKRNMIGIKGTQTANADLVVKNGMQVIKQAAAT